MHSETSFDETLLSGYLDGELTQGEAQRVRVHLDDHPESRELLRQLAAMRSAALSTELPVPHDDQWDSRPRGPASRLARGIGWAVFLTWLTAAACFAVWELWTGPAGWWTKALAAGLVGGPLLLLLSVLWDRLRVMKTDRYRRVLK